ncbi:MAG: membrane protein insertase YidC [Alphaproteobacteria bacterium]|jgi:YidC/Oxa1 family membrane protein insertase|uniref:membrane protein insertase YidC n=1 Tax=Brevundimonas sp. TaxID=1871086 RepID=UPI00182C9F4D|nr:membrane protein insertase YidC [Brevundimonas sp.]MBA3051104.1 membrane protein insertase YidC [Brevundimonas sp.]MBU3972985.1 membrane protein insertase YidC [Alphaproteobacteria bacterium]MBU4040768.1 membrane protein insertase YidC [Alphaproteobacteria bacterium]MBU4136765.1 membrane protein insertase YidC [Alphaproteobacteria bacterium]
MPPQDNSRNTILFVVIAAIMLLAYSYFVMQPQAERRRAAQQAATEQTTDAPVTAPSPSAAVFTEDRTVALARGGARVPIQTETVTGSLSLRGARIDDLFLTGYQETNEADSPPVELFRPEGMRHAYQAQFGWNGPNVPGGVPGPATPWRLTEGATLTPTTPVTLTWDNGAGLRFTRRIAVDAQYLFTVTDTVANFSAQPITIAPWGRIERQGVPDVLGRNQILHEGGIGTFGTDGKYTTQQLKYKAWAKKPVQEHTSTGGWMGITDKYWLAALIPQQDEQIQAAFRVTDAGHADIHSATMLGESRSIAPGRQITETQRLFAGAKRNEILSGYEKSLELPRFIYAIDWGFLFFLTRPIFMLVEFYYGILGNFGLAILALTLTVRLIMFPLANKSYESMSKMRTLQPKMEELKKKHPDDPAKQQQELMALYQKEKINPLAGCLPLLLQIPVFYAVYKMLFVTIEMRHEPFFGWIRDLSAPDPSTIWNLFGLIPWDPSSTPLIGTYLAGTFALSILAIFYGLTMWLQMAMSPPAPDPMQRRIFQFMPVVFTFIMATFPAGLLIYWAWSNILTIIQQYVIMHRLKAENPIDTFIARLKQAKA